MKWGLPRLRLAGLALPLLTAGCMSGVMPGTDAPDPSCVLLCALTREIAGDPAPPPAVMAAAPKPAHAVSRHVRRPVARPRPPDPAKAASAARVKPKRVAARAHIRPVRHEVPAEVSVVRQAPARVEPPKPVAIVPAAPIAATPPPAEPPRSLTQAIPGSAGIMVPSWQSQ